MSGSQALMWLFSFAWCLAGAAMLIAWWRHRARDAVFTPEALGTLAFAGVVASMRSAPHVEPHHLLFALAKDEGGSARLLARGIDAPKLVAALAAPSTGSAEGCAHLSDQAQRVIASAARRSGPKVGLEALVAAVVAEPSLREILREARGAEAPAPAPLADLAAVVLRNDETTTMEFVVELLREIFGCDELEAYRLMIVTHHMGSARLGPYTMAEAERRAHEATARARACGFPLRLDVEPHEAVGLSWVK